MEAFKKSLLFITVTLGFIFLIYEYFYQDRSIKNDFDYWYRRGKKVAGF
jgi:hypothetical protein